MTISSSARIGVGVVAILSCLLTMTATITVSARSVMAGTSISARGLVPTKRVKLAIGGMDCKGCESGIVGELTRTPGVVAATVSYERLEAVVDYDPAKITTAEIIAAIKGAGFTAKVKKR